MTIRVASTVHLLPCASKKRLAASTVFFSSFVLQNA
ncbi:Uncharacterised protein [uncultured archaeon]|nr:Uncharacterised protein [uncultured archaeon]